MKNSVLPSVYILCFMFTLFASGCSMNTELSTRCMPWNMTNESFFSMIDDLSADAIEDGNTRAMYDLCMLYSITDTERASYVSDAIGRISISSNQDRFAAVVERLPFEVEQKALDAIQYERNGS